MTQLSSLPNHTVFKRKWKGKTPSEQGFSCIPLSMLQRKNRNINEYYFYTSETEYRVEEAETIIVALENHKEAEPIKIFHANCRINTIIAPDLLEAATEAPASNPVSDEQPSGATDDHGGNIQPQENTENSAESEGKHRHRLLPKSDIDAIFRYFASQNPEPETELNYVNHYTLLVAVVLSAQATDVGVNKATEALFKVVQTPEHMVALGEEKLKSYIKTIGLFNSKAKNVIALSEALIARHHSKVPDDFDALRNLPGVGVKTANVVLNCAFGHPTIAVDTHVFRVSNRIGLVHTTSPEKTGAPLLKAIPKQWQQHAHHWLILHGRYVCKARKPDCAKCGIYDYCLYQDKTA